jgi:hypothetical protein
VINHPTSTAALRWFDPTAGAKPKNIYAGKAHSDRPEHEKNAI